MFFKKSVTQKHQINASSIVLQAQPYQDTSMIASIDTHLKRRWKYSPLFIKPIVETDVKLTGSRKKDYKLAEASTGCFHVPGVTVWHHAWLKDNLGNYRMQLVDFSEHQKTCPHAGGCKRWSIEHKTIYRSHGAVYVSDALVGKLVMGKTVFPLASIRTGHDSLSYGDYVIDFIFNSTEGLPVMSVNRYVRKKSPNALLRAWGLDPYGNFFFSGTKGQLYFLDHETCRLISLSINERDILR